MGRLTRLVATTTSITLGGAGAFAWVAAGRILQRPEPDAYSTPADFELAFEQVSFRSRNNGVALRGWLIPAQDAPGTIIFCPGHTGSMHSDLVYAPWFHEAGYELLMFDWRGRGRSDGPVTSLGILERGDVLGAIDFLQERGVERVGLMGFSMGGAVAMVTSPMSDAVAAVVSDGGFTRVRDVVASGMVQRSGVPPAIARLISHPVIWAASIQLGVELVLMDPIRWADYFRAPLLMIHGQHDPYVPASAARELYHAAREPKELWMVPEAGHRDVYQLREAEYQEKVIGFFDRWLVASNR